MGRKRWKEIKYDKKKALELAQECDADVFAVLLLLSRGIDTAEKINEFLYSEESELSSPFRILDMDRAVARITSAIESGEKILVYGDYDADGVTATAVLYGYLTSVGADADKYIPSRTEDGYGLSLKTAEMIVKKGYDLVITVDNGISSIAEADYLRENGVDLIVTDHHTVGEEIPDCIAVVNPHRKDDSSPEKNFAGCGVAYKLVVALEEGNYDVLGDEFLDIVTIGTIADIVPLTGENRTIVKRGLRLLSQTSRPGLARLAEAVGFGEKELRSTDIAFYLAPKINAAGRVYTADIAVDLLLSEDEEEAEALTLKLLEANTERQVLEGEMITQIEELFDREPERRSDKVIVAYGNNFHSGVIGIAAARLVEKYSRPALVLSIDGSGIAKGSARSVEGFPLYDALSAVSDVLVRFGGHKQAAGFALKEENIELFRKRINEYSANFDDVFPSLTIDCRVNPEKLTIDILDSLEDLAPFGADNPEPVFGINNMRVAAIKPIKENKHIRINFTGNRANVSALYFNMSTDRFPFDVGDLVDVAFRVDKNEFQGNVSLSVQIKDIRPAGADDDGLFNSLSVYYNHKLGFKDERVKKMLCPDRNFITAVYKHIRAAGSFPFSPEILCLRSGFTSADAGKAQICLDALTEMKLLTLTDSVYRVNPTAAKVDLTDSTVLQSVGYCG